MPHRHPHKPAHHVKPKYKKLALIAAAAALLSTTSLPGMPTSTVHAASNDMSASTSQQVGTTNDSSSKINAGRADIQKTPNSAKPENPTPQGKKNISKTSGPDQKTVERNTPKKTSPTENTNNSKTSVTPPTAAKEKTEKPKPHHPTKDSGTEQKKNAQPKEQTKPPTSGAAPTHYKDVLDISATAYAPGAHDNGQWGDKTYTGTTVRPGIIAVDPNLIPLGSRVYIEYPDGRGEYAIAEDTGGAIKGNRIDVAKQTVNEAEDFGIQKVKVYVINSPKNA